MTGRSFGFDGKFQKEIDEDPHKHVKNTFGQLVPGGQLSKTQRGGHVFLINGLQFQQADSSPSKRFLRQKKEGGLAGLLSPVGKTQLQRHQAAKAIQNSAIQRNSRGKAFHTLQSFKDSHFSGSGDSQEATLQIQPHLTSPPQYVQTTHDDSIGRVSPQSLIEMNSGVQIVGASPDIQSPIVSRTMAPNTKGKKFLLNSTINDRWENFQQSSTLKSEGVFSPVDRTKDRYFSVNRKQKLGVQSTAEELQKHENAHSSTPQKPAIFNGLQSSFNKREYRGDPLMTTELLHGPARSTMKQFREIAPLNSTELMSKTFGSTHSGNQKHRFCLNRTLQNEKVAEAKSILLANQERSIFSNGSTTMRQRCALKGNQALQRATFQQSDTQPTSARTSLAPMRLTSNEWMTKKYMLEVDKGHARPFVCADALSTIMMEEHFNAQDSTFHSRKDSDTAAGRNDFEVLKKRAANSVMTSTSSVQQETPKYRYRWESQNLQKGKKQVEFGGTDRLHRYYNYKCEQRQKLDRQKNGHILNYGLNEEVCLDEEGGLQTGRQYEKQLKRELVEANKELNTARKRLKKESEEDEFVNFDNMVTELRDLYDGMKEDTDEAADKKTSGKVMMTEQEKNMLKGINTSVENINLLFASKKADDSGENKDLKIAFPGNVYVKNEKENANETIPVSNVVLQQKRKVFLAYLRKIGSQMKAMEEKLIKQRSSSKTFQFQGSGPIRNSALIKRKLASELQSQTTRSLDSNESLVRSFNQDSNEDLMVIEDHRETINQSATPTKDNHRKDVYSVSPELPAGILKSAHKARGAQELSDASPRNKRVLHAEFQHIDPEVFMQGQDAQIFKQSICTNKPNSPQELQPQRPKSKTLHHKKQQQHDPKAEEAANHLFQEHQRVMDQNLSAFNQSTGPPAGKQIKHAMSQINNDSPLDVYGKLKFEHQVCFQNLKQIIAAGDKTVYNIACDNILSQSDAAQQQYKVKTFTSPGMSHPRMDFTCLPVHLKRRLQAKCEGDHIKAQMNSLSPEDIQNKNLYYDNKHIKDQGLAFLKQIDSEI